MADSEKTIVYDFESQEIVTDALLALINSYPAMPDGEEVAFATLEGSSGIAMFPTSGAVIKSEKRAVTGDVEQECLYPAYIVYRAMGLSEGRRNDVKEWLDSLGRWLEKQAVDVDGTEHKISEYPDLGDGRRFERIYRASPGYLLAVNADGTEDWAIMITAQYRNEF